MNHLGFQLGTASSEASEAKFDIVPQKTPLLHAIHAISFEKFFITVG